MIVKYYSWLRAKTDCDSEAIELPADVATVGDLAEYLARRHEAAAVLFRHEGALRFMVDRRYVQPSHAVSSSDTVEIYPPVTGG